MAQPQKILIVGGGIAGTTLASFLLLSPPSDTPKPHITILERSSSINDRGQNIDIRGPGTTVIRKLGLEGVIRDNTTGEEGVRFVDEKNRIWAENAADRTGEVQTGTADIEILRGRLAHILYARSKSIAEEKKEEGGKLEFIFGDYLNEIKQDEKKVYVQFAKSGEIKSFDIVVGADGLQSMTRKMVFGVEGEEERVKKLGMYCAFYSMPKGETDSEWRRWYHAPGRRMIMARPHHDKTRINVNLSVINADDKRLNEAAVRGREGLETQKALMKGYFQDAGWESERLVDGMMKAEDFYFDMIAQVKMNKWSKGRVVLLGDAGYCGSPISGMGTTLALVGAYHLSGALLRHPDDHEAAFAACEHEMRPIVDKAQNLPPGAPYTFSPETWWGILILHSISWFITSSGLPNLLFKWAGRPANNVPVEEYGIRSMDEWHGYDVSLA